MKIKSAWTAIVIVPLLTTCGGEAGQTEMPATQAESMTAERSLHIVTPASGDTIQGPSVPVRLEASGFTVVAAGDSTPNSGHLHLFLDQDLTAAGVPIPVEPGAIIHLGTGATDYVLENVAPGEHRLIAVAGDAVHIPLQPWVVDTVRFVVR